MDIVQITLFIFLHNSIKEKTLPFLFNLPDGALAFIFYGTLMEKLWVLGKHSVHSLVKTPECENAKVLYRFLSGDTKLNLKY